jgi:hypothetical protein
MKKLWSLPPKYLSVSYLFDEALVIDTEIQRINIFSMQNLRESQYGIIDTFPKRYTEYGGYLFIRLRMIIDELERRNVQYTAMSETVPAGKSESPFDLADTERDIVIYQYLIEESEEFDEFDRISQLSLLSPEDIFSENEFLISTYIHSILGDSNGTTSVV